MALFFWKNKSTISRHIRNVFEEGELEKNSSIAKNTTQLKKYDPRTGKGEKMMIENLLCHALLLKSELITFDRYEEYLNIIFLKEPDNDLLLELQYLTSDCYATVNLINEEFCRKEVDVKYFGVILMQELKDIYYNKYFEIEEFGRRTYLLWKNIPCDIGKEEPFHTLSYADDPLSWGDVNQTCKLYEELFEYYK